MLQKPSLDAGGGDLPDRPAGPCQGPESPLGPSWGGGHLPSETLDTCSLRIKLAAVSSHVCKRQSRLLRSIVSTHVIGRKTDTGPPEVYFVVPRLGGIEGGRKGWPPEAPERYKNPLEIRNRDSRKSPIRQGKNRNSPRTIAD
ncbi:Hypothetical predicted protein [Pelobates cultripes]|uniref:Uncharacterized protein n=1 Tax=Pelobates cultripes TaxID=61616 RepID=A0AAD1SP63_PELCU|nr:Hypothetical predicted protein [Pelobates cultripes]